MGGVGWCVVQFRFGVGSSLWVRMWLLHLLVCLVPHIFLCFFSLSLLILHAGDGLQKVLQVMVSRAPADCFESGRACTTSCGLTGLGFSSQEISPSSFVMESSVDGVFLLHSPPLPLHQSRTQSFRPSPAHDWQRSVSPDSQVAACLPGSAETKACNLSPTRDTHLPITAPGTDSTPTATPYGPMSLICVYMSACLSVGEPNTLAALPLDANNVLNSSLPPVCVTEGGYTRQGR